MLSSQRLILIFMQMSQAYHNEAGLARPDFPKTIHSSPVSIYGRSSACPLLATA
jgi:hypothetical protein